MWVDWTAKPDHPGPAAQFFSAANGPVLPLLFSLGRDPGHIHFGGARKRLEAEGVKRGTRIPPDLYCGIPAVILSTDGSRIGSFGPALKRLGLTRLVKITAPHFLAVAQIAASSDLLGSLPIHLARHLARPFSLNLSLPPFEPPPPKMHKYWDRRMDNVPAHLWLRSVVANVLSLELEGTVAL